MRLAIIPLAGMWVAETRLTAEDGFANMNPKSDEEDRRIAFDGDPRPVESAS